MSAAGSSIIAPAEHAIGKDLDIHDDFVLQLIFSIFLIGYIIGPLFLAPLSELYGRAMILRWSNLWFTAFILGCGFAKTTAQMLVFRLMAGLGACAPQTIGGGVLSDCFSAEQRGKAIAIYTLAPVLGPSIGPLISGQYSVVVLHPRIHINGMSIGFITANTTWRWCFWMLAIIGACIQACLWFGLQETYPARLLHTKARRLQKENPGMIYRSQLELEKRSTATVIGQALIRPVKLIGTQLIVQYLALYMSLVYGIIFIMLSTFPKVWSEQYNESVQIGGLNYLSITIGMFAGAEIAGLVLDRMYKRLTARSGKQKGRPEFRVPIIFVATVLIASGLFIYGWTAAYRVHWIAPNIGAVLFACGAMVNMAALQSYIIDAYPRYAASAIGVTAIARSITGFSFPLFANAMYNSIGWGYGNSILAFAALGIGIPGAAGLWLYGERLRRASPYAAGD